VIEMSNYKKWQNKQKRRKKAFLETEKGEKENEKKERQRRKSGRKTKEEEFKEKIDLMKKKRLSKPDQHEKGDKRESRFEETLEFLQKERKILHYKRSGKLSRADIDKRIDFYLIVLNGSRREVYCVDVTGPDWVERKKREKHPKNEKKKIIGIEPDEAIKDIIKKIEKEIPLISKDS